MKKGKIPGLFLANKRLLALTSLCILICILSALFFIRYLIKPNVGLVVNYPEVIYKNEKIIYAPKTPFSPALSAGLLPYRDAILKVNSRIIRNTRDILLADSEILSFDPVSIHIIRDDKEYMIVSITPVFSMMRADWFFILLFSIVLGFTSFYLTYHRSFTNSYIFIILACLFYLIFTCVKPFYYESCLTNTLVHIGKITTWLLVFFALYFPFPRGKRLFRGSVIISLLILFLAFSVTRLLYYDQWMSSGSEKFLLQYKLLGKICNIAEGCAYLFFLALLGSASYVTPILKEKKRLEWIIAGFLVSILPYFFFDQLPIVLEAGQEFRLSLGAYANLFLIVFPIALIIGLTDRRVLNFRYFFSRYLVYVSLALLILFFFSILYNPFVTFLQYNYGTDHKISGFIVTIFLFLSLFPLRSLLLKASERIFYKPYLKTTISYVNRLERDNRELSIALEELENQKAKFLQNEKYRDVKLIIGGIIRLLGSSTGYISEGVLELEKLADKFSASRRYDGVAETIRPMIGSILTGNTGLRDIIDKLNLLTNLSTAIPARVDITLLIKTAISKFRAHCKSCTIRYKRQHRIIVTVSPQDIISALFHIFNNAFDSEESSVWVTCSIEENHCCIFVRDNGFGISRFHIKKIFNPFFTTKQNHIGLGLYVCKIAIERNGGTIKLESDEGAGTTVRVLLPLRITNRRY